MSRLFKILLPLFFTIVFTPRLYAQFRIDAQLRTRFELRNGYQMLAAKGEDPAALVSQRTRIIFSYETDNLKLRITPQDVRLWGGDKNVNSTGITANTELGLFEGFTEVKLGSVGWMSVGRQQLVYDSRHLLGNRNWNQNGISYDALLFKLALSGWNLHVAGSWNTLNETSSNNYYPDSRIKSYNFVWVNHKFPGNFNLSLLHIASGVTETDSTNTLHFRQTTGFYIQYPGEDLKFWANAYYQYGRNKLGKTVSAFLMDADMCYSIGKLTPGIGFGYLSGNSHVGAGQSTDHLFDILYGNRHTFFGFMDYFRSFDKDTRQGGLADYYLYMDFKFSKSVSLCNTAHYFMLAQTNTTTPDDRKLGYENDLILTCKFADWGGFECGYLFMLPAKSLKEIQDVSNSKFSQFLYLQLTITPVIYRQQNESRSL